MAIGTPRGGSRLADERFVGIWSANRPYLVDLAFGMLGDIGAAEDAVQEAFSRLSTANLDVIEDPRGWLIVVTSRICLDVIGSARSRREHPHESSSLESRDALHSHRAVDPADRTTLDDEVRLALLVVLKTLRPAERVAFVLHDVFQLPFEEIAETMNRPVAGCRQLARRARMKIQSADRHHRVATGQVEDRRVMAKFIDACAGGDLEGLLELLDADVHGDIDLGPRDARTGQTRRGAREVAGNLLRFFGPNVTLVSNPVGPGCVLLAFKGRDVLAVILLSIGDARIRVIHVIADPDEIAFLSTQLTTATNTAG
jgi:RNA polymerase sigma-70 factor, ECF subfamily